MCFWSGEFIAKNDIIRNNSNIFDEISDISPSDLDNYIIQFIYTLIAQIIAELNNIHPHKSV